MTEQQPRVLLIDLENCPSQINQLMENLEQYSQVVVCYAQSGAKIPVDWIMVLTATINDNRLKLVKMLTVGKNAADFGITFWAGILMTQLPLNTHFDIVSNDADLDYAVSLLIDQGRSAERVGIKKEIQLVPTEITITAKEDEYRYLYEYCFHLLSHSRPAKKETLLNSINAKFKAENIDSNQFIELLIKHGVLIIKENKVIYNQQKLNTVANAI
ncbi:MAG: NYN domain-containing protein [Methylococcales bacterium]|nr:NYN domain-containing protein [Methylococcales bacterium]